MLRRRESDLVTPPVHIFLGMTFHGGQVFGFPVPAIIRKVGAMLRIVSALFFGFSLLAACGSPQPLEKEAQKPAVSAPAHDYRYEIVPAVDSAGQTHGFGYDIYDGPKKIIRQSTIPGEPGLEGFVSEEEAHRVAELVVTKLKQNNGFPTVSHEELVGLGITLQGK